MMTFDLFVALLAFAFVSLVSPGPNNFMLLASGMNFGWYRSLPHMLGIGLGFPLMIVLVGLGIVSVFEWVPYSFLILKFVSAAYLLYLAWKIATIRPDSSGSGDAHSHPLSFFQAAAFQWVNPKAWAMALTATVAFSLEATPLLSVLVIALTFTAIGCVTITSWTLLGQQLRFLLRKPLAYRCFNIGCALVLVLSLHPILTMGG